jgi:hypothetical protein
MGSRDHLDIERERTVALKLASQFFGMPPHVGRAGLRGLSLLHVNVLVEAFGVQRSLLA